MGANDDRSADEPTGIPGTSELMSAWPPFVALGLVVAEIGVVMNLFPVAVGGVVLFGASVAGILSDADMTKTPWYTLSAIGLVFVILGSAIVLTQLGTITISAVIPVVTGDPIAIRGTAIFLGGLVLASGGLVGIVKKPRRHIS